MKRGVLFLTAWVAGCQGASDPQAFETRADTEIGRYQIVNDTKNDGVFWIDTATGLTQQCQWNAVGNEWQCYTVRPAT